MPEREMNDGLWQVHLLSIRFIETTIEFIVREGAFYFWLSLIFSAHFAFAFVLVPPGKQNPRRDPLT